MNQKKVPQSSVLIFVDWYLPGYKAGGPIQSIKNIVAQLATETNFYIVTSDRDLGDTEAYPNLALNVWIKTETYSILYTSPEKRKKGDYKKIIQGINPSVIYLNSMFSISFSLIPLLAAKSLMKKTILAPRGMLGSGALSLKPIKKKTYLALFILFRLDKGIIFHATAKEEMEEIKRVFGLDTKIKIASNLPGIPSGYTYRNKEKNTLNVFFLSRINEKKNFLGAVEALRNVNSTHKINFTIIGPVDGEDYWEKCQLAISQLKDSIQCTYLGAVANTDLKEILLSQHVLLLPTLNENYGHVIMESWQYGCPVIISDQTPWKNLEIQHLGHEIALEDTANFSKALERISSYTQEEFDFISLKSYEYALNYSKNLNVVKDTRLLLI